MLLSMEKPLRNCISLKVASQLKRGNLDELNYFNYLELTVNRLSLDCFSFFPLSSSENFDMLLQFFIFQSYRQLASQPASEGGPQGSLCVFFGLEKRQRNRRNEERNKHEGEKKGVSVSSFSPFLPLSPPNLFLLPQMLYSFLFTNPPAADIRFPSGPQRLPSRPLPRAYNSLFPFPHLQPLHSLLPQDQYPGLSYY